MKKLLLLSALLISLKSNSQVVTTYTFTPYATVASVNVTCALTTSNGQTTDYIVNSVYPQFSRDSQKVQFFNTSTGHYSFPQMPDSIKHFYSTSQQFLTVKSIDSFFHLKMVK